jgi:hypothetical protein
MTDQWVPFSKRGSVDEINAYETLHEDVPPWLSSTITRWIRAYLTPSGALLAVHVTERLEHLERELHLPLPWLLSTMGFAVFPNTTNRVIELLEQRGLLLDAIDFIANRRVNFEQSQVTSMSKALIEGGSAYHIAVWDTDDGHRAELQRRVDPTAIVAFEQASINNRAGHHLRNAWSAAYRRNPDPSASYHESVRSVEAAAKPHVLPADSLATLGKMITAMNDKPDKWLLNLLAEPTGDVTPVVVMMKALWTQQIDRHGTSDEDAPLSVTQEQAEAAVHLAATLVQWFAAGTVQLRT